MLADAFSYLVSSWRHGRITAVRSAFASQTTRKQALREDQAREVVSDLARNPGSRHHLIALAEQSAGGVDATAFAQMPTTTLVSLLHRAIQADRLFFLSEDRHVKAMQEPPSRALTALIERLMPQGRRLSFEGRAYRLIPAGWTDAAPEGEEVVRQDEARATLSRMRDRFARSVQDKEAWDKAAALSSDAKVATDIKPTTVVLLRLREYATAVRVEASAPAPAPAPRPAPPPILAPVEDAESEFLCPDEQAEAMAAAARDGLPFCMECACGEESTKKAA